jgi:hypothetical protein
VQPLRAAFLDGEHRLARLLGGRAGAAAGRELETFGRGGILGAGTQRHAPTVGVGQADAGAVHLQHPGGRRGQPDGEQLRAPQTGLVGLGQGLAEPPGDGHG